MALIKRINLLPENPVYVGDRPALEMDLSMITYDPDSAKSQHLSGIDELLREKTDAKISWINISGLKNIDAIKRLGEFHNIHPLTIEDILHTEEQPKMETFEKYRFLSVKTIQREKNFHLGKKGKRTFPFFGKNTEDDEEIDEFLIDQVSLIIMKNVLVSFQEIPGDTFDGVRRRILNGIGDIRKMGTDYLAYTIIDAVVDEYFLALNHMEEDIENLEDRAAKTSDDQFIQEIQDTKQYLFKTRKAISPLKDNLMVIMRQGIFFQMDELKPFLRDLNDNLNNAMTTLENHREWLTNIMDVHLSVLSHQTNKVMKVLAIISTIFIPLTFIAGVYGMNFKYMPELGYALAYPIALGGMGLIALVMIVFFKIRRWF